MLLASILFGVIILGLLNNKKHPALQNTYGPYLYNGVPNHQQVSNTNFRIPEITDRHRLLLKGIATPTTAASDKTVLRTLSQSRNPTKEYYPYMTNANMVYKYRPFRM